LLKRSKFSLADLKFWELWCLKSSRRTCARGRWPRGEFQS